MLMYMIRHLPTKQISAGGSSPFGNPKSEGKMYAGMGALKNHLNLALGCNWGNNPTDISLRKEFEPYLTSELVKLETETFKAEFDPHFIFDYLKQKVVEMSEDKGYPIQENTKKKFGL